MRTYAVHHQPMDTCGLVGVPILWINYVPSLPGSGCKVLAWLTAAPTALLYRRLIREDRGNMGKAGVQRRIPILKPTTSPLARPLDLRLLSSAGAYKDACLDNMDAACTTRPGGE
jgi:hypothetical protein